LVFVLIAVPATGAALVFWAFPDADRLLYERRAYGAGRAL